MDTKIGTISGLSCPDLNPSPLKLKLVSDLSFFNPFSTKVRIVQAQSAQVAPLNVDNLEFIKLYFI